MILNERTLMDTDRITNELNSITEQIQEGIKRGKYTVTELQAAIRDKTKEAALSTDQYVHDNPWTVVGMAAILGLLVGLLMHRR